MVIIAVLKQELANLNVSARVARGLAGHSHQFCFRLRSGSAGPEVAVYFQAQRAATVLIRNVPDAINGIFVIADRVGNIAFLGRQ